jgi:uncharacterized repeat protein (TIGR03803 family)
VFKVLVSFDRADGWNPVGVLAQDRGGNLWGTTNLGGVNLGGSQIENGTVFKISPTGALTRAHYFIDAMYGTNPYAGVVLGTDGYLYGTTEKGGTGGVGVVFKVSLTGSETILFDFDDSSPVAFPTTPLTLGADGSFYGTTYGGIIFEIAPTGKLTVLHAFDGTDGTDLSGLVQGADGNFYGTAYEGGNLAACGPSNYGCGTIFKITPAGAFTVLHSFDGFSDGAFPTGGVVQGTDGNFYGTTASGGTPDGCGTVFKITPTGTLSVLYVFNCRTAITLGDSPYGPLVQGTDGNFYGSIGEINGVGGIFQITPEGVVSIISDLTGGPNGLIQHTNGVFYGTALSACCYAGGGGTDAGAVFSLDMGLGAFIKTVLNFGRVGSTVQILGTGLAGATAVTFNGKPATCFSVVSDTFMTAMVPDGATTGPIEVTTPKETLKSNVNFNVQ